MKHHLSGSGTMLTVENVKVLTGTAGEFFAAARLSELGWSVGILPKNTSDYDLLAHRSASAGTTPVAIQVKTSVGGAYWGLHVSKSPPRRRPDHEWFVLVALDRDRQSPPILYCVPADIIYVFAWAGWTAKSKRESGPTTLNFHDFDAYRDRFDLLVRDATSVEWEFTGAIWQWLQRSDTPEHIPRAPQELPAPS